MTKKKKIKKMNPKKEIILKCILILLSILLLVYALYTVINLAISPTDSVMIKKSTITEEETTVRIYY